MIEGSGYPPGSFEIVGPFDYHRVLVYGREVPHLTACPANGGVVHLQLDSRYGLDLSAQDAERVIPFIADCIAVASGFACHPRRGHEARPLTPFPRVFGIFEET
ncbi:MAG TPA: hypothetical protein VME70_09005 [Mycobacteriales bacterium]|nr:hypothetical protein [Mycobacteriales bacterium]